ncbi:MAG: hypothetical protein HDS16_09005 [Bacteroides sp.]|nr:hypothetical protein [Bacteroides sp.]
MILKQIAGVLLRKYLPVFLCCLIGLCSCSDSNMPEVENFTEDISVSIKLRAYPRESARAVDESGTALESAIDLENLKILIFDENETLYDVLYDNGKMPSGANLTCTFPGEYQLTTSLSPSRYNASSEFAIVVLANWETGSDNRFETDLKGHPIDTTEIGSLTISDLKEMDFVINPNNNDKDTYSWIPSEGSLIPMFGSRYTSLRGYDHSIFNESNPMPVPEIKLVRAVTKIEIENLDTDAGREITGIELVHRNRKGWLMQDYSFQGWTDNVTSLTSRGNEQFTTLPLRFNQTGNVYTAYIPEMKFNDVNSRQAIRVEMNLNGVTFHKWIYLAPYGADSRPILSDNYDSDWNAIKRNYIYRYLITSLGFEFIISVEPWKFGGKVHIDLE